ncbi:MAG: hypothetical protein KAU28_04490 [Phycisphaerae bacterium]|nr:hypothetical protein [Phycisphaerae bacterium]
MGETTGRFNWVVKLSRITLIATIAFLGLVLIVVAAQTVLTALSAGWWPALVHGAMSVLGLLLLGTWAYLVYGIIRVLVANECAVSHTSGRFERIETLLQDHGESTNKLIELASLSDRAKSLIFREREINEFRDRIHEDLMRQDYKTAQAMIETIETEFGHVDEAANLREEIQNFRKATLEEKIDAAVSRIQEIIDRHDWVRAIRETQRVLRLFKDNPKVAALPGRIQSARTRHKRDLLQAYDEAVRKNDVDRSIELLKELDIHLTPQEAAALEESARGVFRTKLHNLGVQFAIRVTDEQWAEAVAVGEQIINEFPNSRMAHEVRTKMERLHGRAAAARSA